MRKEFFRPFRRLALPWPPLMLKLIESLLETACLGPVPGDRSKLLEHFTVVAVGSFAE